MDSNHNQEPTTPDQSTPTPDQTPSTPMPEQPPTATPTDASATTNGQHVKPRKFGLDIVIGIILVALVGGALYGVNAYLKPKSNTAQSPVKKDIAVLRVSVENPLPTALYPKTQADAVETLVNHQVFEGLTAFEEQTKIVPQLAVSWTNPDVNTWIFKLRTGVKFHNGNTLTSKQVKASLEQSKGYFMGENLATSIKSVEAIDASTIKITTDGPDPLLTNKLTELFIWDTDANKTGDSSTGTGAYTLASTTSAVLKLTAFDGFHGGHVYTRSVELLAAADDTATKAFVANKSVDVASTTFLTPTEAGAMESKTIVINGTSHFVFNTLRKGSPLGKLKVRQALAQAIDKTAVTKASGSTTPVAAQTVPVGIPGYNPDIKDLPYDLVAAKAALVAAGYPKGFTITMTFFPRAQPTVEELRRQYALVGVTLKLDPESDQKTLIQKAIGGGTDMYYNTVNSVLIDATDILSDFIDTPNYNNPALNALNTTAASTLDPTKRVAILQQMSKLLVDDLGDIPIHASANSELYFAKGIHITQDNQADAQIGAYFWKVYKD